MLVSTQGGFQATSAYLNPCAFYVMHGSLAVIKLDCLIPQACGNTFGSRTSSLQPRCFLLESWSFSQTLKLQSPSKDKGKST